MNDQPVWKNQCDAARSLREQFGSETALGYLVGEKFRGFLRASQHEPALAADVPAFAAEITDSPGRSVNTCPEFAGWGPWVTFSMMQISRCSGPPGQWTRTSSPRLRTYCSSRG